MNAFRIVFLAGCLLTLAGGGYLSWAGVGRESRDLGAGAASIRASSAGNGGGGVFGAGRVK